LAILLELDFDTEENSLMMDKRIEQLKEFVAMAGGDPSLTITNGAIISQNDAIIQDLKVAIGAIDSLNSSIECYKEDIQRDHELLARQLFSLLHGQKNDISFIQKGLSRLNKLIYIFLITWALIFLILTSVSSLFIYKYFVELDSEPFNILNENDNNKVSQV
jgi:hypothetical protein